MNSDGKESPKNDLGPLLRKVRVSRGWTQDEVTRRLGALGWDCDRSKYGKIEAQMVRVRDSQVVYFGRLFGSEFREAFWLLQLRAMQSERGRA